MNTKLKIKRGGAIALAILAVGSFALSASAGQQQQTDTNNLVVNSTNTFILSGDVSGSFTNGEQPTGSLIKCTTADDAWIECGGFFTNTTAGVSNVTFRIAASVTGTIWTNSFATVTVQVPASSTNYAGNVLLIQNVPPILGLRAVENVNTGNVTAAPNTCYIKVFTKTGI